MKWAAMLRGINLGKRTLVKADMIGAAESLGYTDARTLLASGNLVFDAGHHPAEAIERDLHEAVDKRTGIKSDVFVRNRAQFGKLIEANPFPEVARDRPSQLLVIFHHAPVAHAEVAKIVEAHDGPERLEAVGHELFIDYPEGMGRSTLERTMARLKPALPLGTGRNWNTVTKLKMMLDD
jgi:uncharacterized protein (DUF1697 family)